MASTSNQTTPCWNVFLSFRGEDTRRNFTSHLHKALDRAGIQTFMDEHELPRGEEMSLGLLKAIQESKISIVVFSKNYASSTWCLDELVKILECRKTMGQLVLPVFYNVSPSDVRYQCGSFEEAFGKHKIRFVGDMDKVEKWRAVLTEAADLSGYPLDENVYEANLIDKIVEKVLLEVNPIYLNVAKEPVGIYSRVKDIIQLLSIGNNGVRRIGIYGMGGVGKTTIAKAVYNEKFNCFYGSCFLANIREASKPPNGLVRVQEQLISEVLKMKNITIGTVARGISLIQERLHSKKVLIVLDDLDHLNQFNSLAGQRNWFASGSVIIITTRDGCLLDQIQVEERYLVKELDNNESLELFNRHAFGKAKPLDDFMELSKDIVSYAGGLPLALEVFGSNLFDQTMTGWRSFVDKLQHIPNNEIHEKLIISFDALDDDNVKDIFLDIACFFIGMYKDEAVTVLGSYYSVENEINNLIKRCLLTINDKNELRMHDLIRDMGRRIVRNKFPKEPGKQSRLWSYKDICYVLKNGRGTEEIEGIIPDDCDAFNKVLGEVPLNTETFKKMNRLRLLNIDGVHLTGSFEHIFEDLRWLSWGRCPLEHFPSDFHPEKLVVLDLQLSKLKRLWDGKLQFLEQLKILNLESCELLTTTPDFTRVPCLEDLILTRCTSLVEVHPSIGCLTRLVYLNLSFCENLRILPSSICNLRAMKYLDLDYCSSLEELPEEFGNIESLHGFFAVDARIRKLPDSIGRLTKLVELDLSGCNNLTTLPSSICDLRLLESLVLDCCENLEELPKELGNIESLRKLWAEGTSISKLPYSIGRLSKLVELDLSYCQMLRYLPSSICNLRALQQLDLWGCSKLEWLPKDFGNIESLKKLRAGETKLRKIPHSIGDMKKLEILSLDNVSPSSAYFVPLSVTGLCTLKKLDIGWCQLYDRDIPYNIGSLSSLQDLRLCGNYFRSLPSSLTQLFSLKLLDLTRCQNLWSLSGLPPNLQKLYAGKCTSMQNLPNLSNLIHLEELYLTDCSSLARIHGLEKLSSVTKINMGGCSSLANTFRHSFFQVYCGFWNEIEILLPSREIPGWFSYQKSFDVPNSSLFGGMILWAVRSGRFDTEAVIDNKTSGTKWTCQNWLSTSQVHSWVRIIPETKFSLNNGDQIEVSLGGECDSISSSGVHLVYKSETIEIDGNDRDVEEISYPSKKLKL